MTITSPTKPPEKSYPSLFSSPYLQRLEQWLMVRYPFIYALQLHEAAYLGVVLSAVALILSSLLPVNRPISFYVLTRAMRWLLISLEICALVIWLRRLALFKRAHPELTDKRAWRRYAGYWLAIMFIFAALPVFLSNIKLQQKWRTERVKLATGMLLIRIIEDRHDRRVHPFSMSVDQWAAVLPAELENGALDNLDTYFGWEDYWVNQVDAVEAREFIAENVDSAEIIAAFAANEEPLHRAIAHFGGEPDMRRFELASNSAFFTFRYGFDGTQSLIRNAILLSAAMALHIALVASIISWTQPDRLFATIATMVGTVISIIIIATFGFSLDYPLAPQFLYLYISFLAILTFALWIVIVRKKTIINKHVRIFAVGVLPILVALAPIIPLHELTFNVIGELPRIIFHDERAFSLRRGDFVSWWVDLVTHLYYLPLVPFLHLPLLPAIKRQLTSHTQEHATEVDTKASVLELE